LQTNQALKLIRLKRLTTQPVSARKRIRC